MESELVLGFKEATNSEVFGECNYKLVPWISWDDWSFIKESLFSSSPTSIDLALRRISAWRSRGCLPVIVEVTASIVEIQQKDSYFRDGLSVSDLLAEDMLTMLYCMTIMRLVNGIVEKSRKKNEISIGEAADVIGIPRMLIDIRHECSHRDLPSLRLVRLASTKALDWLKAYYWESQKMAIPLPSDTTANIAKEIKSKIRELAFSLDVKHATKSDSSPLKGKRIKSLCGRSKFRSLLGVRIHSSKPSGSKKQTNKALKSLVKSYLSFPSEVLSILLEFLLESADVADRLDNWKPLIMKLSNKEPQLLLNLLKTLVQMIETRGEHENKDLSCIFEWLVGNIKDLKPPNKTSLQKSTLVKHIIRKCLVVNSFGGNNHLTTATLVLARTACNHILVNKLNKLTSLHSFNANNNNTNTNDESTLALVGSESFYNEQEKLIRQAAKNLVVFKHKKSNLKTKTTAIEKKKNTRWSVAKSWKMCPIGMLPSDVDSSGVLPVLDFKEEEDENLEECNGNSQVNLKREADCGLGVLDDSNVKKLKVSVESMNEEEEVEEEEDIFFENRLMIGGVWKRITEDELINVASAVRILV